MNYTGIKIYAFLIILDGMHGEMLNNKKKYKTIQFTTLIFA